MMRDVEELARKKNTELYYPVTLRGYRLIFVAHPHGTSTLLPFEEFVKRYGPKPGRAADQRP